MDKKKAIAVIDENQEELAGLSDQIWEHPELCFKEHASAEILCTALERYGFTVKKGLAGIPTAFSGQFGSGEPVIGVLGEFDALSGMSQKAGVAVKEPLSGEGGKNNCGHGCGHNLLGVGSLAAALAVKSWLEQTGSPGTVIYFGCPGEEGGSGKAFMARDGVFDVLDAAVSWHPNAVNAIWSFSTLANIQVRYHFTGKSAHAAISPHLGRSALDGLELMNTGVQYLREHVIPEARIHYAITNTGGSSPNVVQAEAEALYLIRAPKNAQVQEIYDRINDIAKGAALMTGTEVEIKMEKACSNIVVNRTIEEVLKQNMDEIPLPEYTKEEEDFAKAIQNTIEGRQTMADRLEKSMGAKGRTLGENYDRQSLYRFIMPYSSSSKTMAGSSDVGDVSWLCPTSQIFAVTCAGGTVEHSWQMVAQGKSGAAHKGMLYAGKVLAGAVIDLMQDSELIRKAKEEHVAQIGPNGYRPLLPPDIKFSVKEDN